MDPDKAYINKMEGEINERKAEINELKANVQQAQAETQLQYDDGIEKAEENVSEFKEASRSAWSDIKSGVMDAWSELSNAAGKAAAKFKRD